MANYIIDGYNLLHKIRRLKDATNPRLELINYIKSNHLTGSRNNKVTIVFDGYDGDDNWTEKEFNIVFSEDITADEVIKEKVSRSRNKSQLLVVTDDREIKDRVRLEGVKITGTKEFLSKSAAHKNLPKNSDDRNLTPSSIMEINDELKKIWLK